MHLQNDSYPCESVNADPNWVCACVHTYICSNFPGKWHPLSTHTKASFSKAKAFQSFRNTAKVNNNLFLLSRYKRQKKKTSHSTCTGKSVKKWHVSKLSQSHQREQNPRTGKCSEPHWFHFLHWHSFIAISRLCVHLLTEHFFMTKHAYLISRLFFFILMWLTHHFLSISTFNASVVKMLISYFRGKSTGTARKTGLRAVPESRASLPGWPFCREGRSADLSRSSLHIPGAASHTRVAACSPERSSERHCLLVPMRLEPAVKTKAAKTACSYKHTHGPGVHVHTHTCTHAELEPESAPRFAVFVIFRQNNN